jgi:FkbM family methyltransferase
MSIASRLQSVVSNPAVALDYAAYRMGRNTAPVPFGGRLAGSTFSELLTIRNLRPTAAEANLIDSLPGQGTIFDVGAHVGIWTIPLALRHPKARIHSFEGSPTTFRTLQTNVARNGIGSATLVNAAVSDREGTLRFQVPQNASVFGRVLTGDNSRNRYDNSSVFEVPAISLSEYCNKNRIDSLEFVKIDVEGAEVQVVRGLLPLLKAGRIGKVWIEVEPDNLSEMGTSVGELASLVESCGYHFCRLAAPGKRVDIRKERDSNMLVIREQ